MTDLRRLFQVACIGVAVVGLLAPSVSAGPSGLLPATNTGPLAEFSSHISHIVFLMQENHAFDSLYGMYCPVTGPYCRDTANGIPPGICLPRPVWMVAPSPTCTKNGASGYKPYNFTKAQLSLQYDMNHDWNASHAAYDGGKMDGFLSAENGDLETLGHYNASTVPVYYDLAEEYGLADNFYSGALSYSLSNHWYTVASNPPNASQTYIIGPAGARADHLYLNQSNQTSSLESELLNSSVSWTYFDHPLSNYSSAIQVPNGSAYDFWDPLEARSQTYGAAAASHFQARSNFFSEAASGTLPDLSWLIPTYNQSDHPPENISDGQSWVASVVDALEASPDWNSTVLFISWDEYGGFYDHVAPPMLDADGDGFRVPLLAVGPWVREGVIDHQNLSFSSILHLMEKRFHLGCLGPRDCNAALPLAMFNFHRAHPRYPIYISPFAKASYPMALQSSGTLPRYNGPFRAPAPSEIDGSYFPDLDDVDWS